MKAIKIMGIIFLITLLESCQLGKSITLDYKEFEIKYIYKNQSLNSAQNYIDRSVKIINKTNKKSLQFDMELDIEHIDEPRFFQIDSIKYDEIKYQNLLWIEDPFAFAITDLENMKILYNSHGEDGVENRIEVKSDKNCIGKIRYREPNLIN